MPEQASSRWLLAGFSQFVRDFKEAYRTFILDVLHIKTGKNCGKPSAVIHKSTASCIKQG
jgi:hypothetical protein